MGSFVPPRRLPRLAVPVAERSIRLVGAASAAGDLPASFSAGGEGWAVASEKARVPQASATNRNFRVVEASASRIVFMGKETFSRPGEIGGGARLFDCGH